MARVGLQSPWQQYYDKISLIFSEDEGVKVLYDESVPEIKLFVEDQTKASALESLLPDEIAFGGVTLTITVVPGNGKTDVCESYVIDALKDNPIVEDIKIVSGIFQYDLVYVIFRKEVVQYYTDDLSDAYGNRTTLWQEIAKELFGESTGIFFCTSVHDYNDIECEVHVHLDEVEE